MKRWIVPAIGLALVASVALAGPLKVTTRGKSAQQIEMCKDCGEKLTCAKAGEHLIGLDVDLDNPKTGAAAMAVHVMDQAKSPVSDAKVKISLSMPGHKHKMRDALTLRKTGHGRYEAATVIVMPGAYQADVAVTLASGDTVKQSFGFSK